MSEKDKELKRLLSDIYKKPYKDKKEWEKFIDQDRVKTHRRLKKQNKNEILVDPYDFEYKRILNDLD